MFWLKNTSYLTDLIFCCLSSQKVLLDTFIKCSFLVCACLTYILSAHFVLHFLSLDKNVSPETHTHTAPPLSSVARSSLSSTQLTDSRTHNISRPVFYLHIYSTKEENNDMISGTFWFYLTAKKMKNNWIFLQII